MITILIIALVAVLGGLLVAWALFPGGGPQCACRRGPAVQVDPATSERICTRCMEQRLDERPVSRR